MFFSVLPTGFGKGLCYACLALAFDKCTGLKKHLCLKVAATSSCSGFMSG